MNQTFETRTQAPEFAVIKQRQQATWASGDFAVIGTTSQIVGESLAEAERSSVHRASPMARGGPRFGRPEQCRSPIARRA
jgi:hypothetical protein